MSLPVLNAPQYSATVPSTQQQIMFRPFLVKEEKLLFMALQGGDSIEMTNAVRNILEACITTEGFDVDKLAMFDIEYLFLQLRGKSVGENVDLKLKHSSGDCKNMIEASVSLDQIQVSFPDGYTDKIQLTNDVGIQFQYPGVKHMSSVQLDDQDFDKLIDFVSSCVVCIYDNDNVYDTFSKSEIKDFLEQLNQQQFVKIQNFFTNSPKLEHDIEWKCDRCGETEIIHLEGLASFFT
jgi:hypothetical protein